MSKHLRYPLFLLFFILISPQLYAQNCSVNAGVDRTICPGASFTLSGTSSSAMPLQASPVWTQIAGPAVTLSPTIISGNTAISNVTNFGKNISYTFRLTAKCQDGSTVFQDVKYIVSDISIAYAGTDQTVCPGLFTLHGSSLGAGEQGKWTKINGDADMPDPACPGTANSTLNIPASSSIQTATYRWTVTKGECTTFDDVVIKNLGTQPVYAGADQSLACYNVTASTILRGSYAAADAASDQSGTWSFVSGPSMPAFDDINKYNTGVSNLVEGTYILRWTVTGPCAHGSSDVKITVAKASQNITYASSDTTIYCDRRTSVLLTGPKASYSGETVSWTQVSGPTTALIQNPNSNGTIVSGLNAAPGNNYAFNYTITNPNTNCASSGNYLVHFNAAPAVNITTANPYFAACGETQVTVNYTVQGGTWTRYALVSAPRGSALETTMGGINVFTTAVASGGPIIGFNKIGTYVIRYLRSTTNAVGGCSDAYNDITIVISGNASPSNAGTKQVLACNVVEALLVSNIPVNGNGKWSQVKGPNNAVFDNVLSPTAKVTGLRSGIYTFRWIISGGDGGCLNSQHDVDIVVSSPVSTTAAAGNAKTTCFGTPVTLAGSALAADETGTWTVLKAGAPAPEVVFSDIHNPGSTVTGLLANTVYTFRWTVANACNSAFSEAKITTTTTAGPKQARAGADQCIPAPANTFVLAGNAPGPGETGTWTLLSGPGNPAFTANQYNTTVTGATNGTYLFQWSLSNGPCVATTDVVEIIISAPSTIANAGPDQNICGTSVVLAANQPAIGQGIWTETEGAGGVVIVNPSLYHTTVTGLTDGRYKFTWTITNGACVTANSDDVVIHVSTPSTLAAAGPDQTLCNQTSTILAANTIQNGTGRWATVSGPTVPVFADLTKPNTRVSNLSYGVYELEWISNGGIYCPTSKDRMTITVRQSANAGVGQTLCDVTTITLSGNPNSTGSWSVVNGPNSPILTPVQNNGAIVTNLITGSYTFRYAIAAVGSCPATSSDVTYSISSPPITANAGPDQEICSPTSNIADIQLAANTPNPGEGTGTWSIENGPAGSKGAFSNLNSASATFKPSMEGVYLLKWEINNGNCNGAKGSNDFVRITISLPPTTAQAGVNQNNLCSNNVNLSGNTPVNGLGTWTLISGPNVPTIDQPNSPATAILNTVPGTYVFRWTIKNGVCTDSFNDVTVIISSVSPKLANAGIDQTICAPSIGGAATSKLNGNQPSANETGNWTVVSAPNGITPTLTNANIYNTGINGLAAGTYTLRWRLNSGSCSSTDDMVITVTDPPSVASITSGNQSICLYQPVNLTALAVTSGTGTWSTVSKPGDATEPIFDQINNSSTGVFGLIAGTYQFTFTTANGNCTQNTATPVTITIIAPPTDANSGSDQTTCFNIPVTLAANTPITGTGKWTVTSGQPSTTYVFSDDTAPNANFTGKVAGTYTLAWTISNGICSSVSTSKIVVQPDLSNNAITAATATFCSGEAPTFTESTPTGGAGSYTYQWQSSTSGGAFTDIAGATGINYVSPALINSTANPIVYNYRRIVSSANCVQSVSIPISITVNPPISGNTITALTSSICFSGATGTIKGGSVTGGSGTYTYQWQQSTNGGAYSNIGGATSPDYDPGVLTNNGTTVIAYRYRRVVSSLSCSSTSASVRITVNPQPTLSSATTATVCSNNMFSYTPTSAVNGTTYSWTRDVVAGISNAAANGGSSISETLINTTNTPKTVTYVFTLSANGCQNPNTFNVAVTVNPSPVGTNASVNHLDCTGNFTYDLQANINNTTNIPSNFSWTVTTNSNVSGQSNGSGTSINQALINHTNTEQQVVFNIIPTATTSGACQGQPFTLTVTVPVCPGMKITKTTSRTTDVATAGDLIPYTIVVTNTANADQTNVVVKDPFLSNSPLVNPVKTGGNQDNVLNRNETWTYIGNYIVAQSDLDNHGKPIFNSGKINNTASVESKELPLPQTAGTIVNINAISSYTVVKSSTTTQITAAGQLVPYQIEVKNTGNTATSNLVVNGPMLTNITLSGGDVNSNGKLDKGETWIFTGSHTVTQSEIDANGNGVPSNGTLSNVVSVSGNKPDGTPVFPAPITSEKVIPIVVDGSFEVKKSTTTTTIIKAGQIVPYTITIANTGKVAISNLEVTDPLLPVLTLYSGDIAPKNGILDVNETWTYTGDYTVTQADIDNNGKPTLASGLLSNQASVKGNYPNGTSDTKNSNPVNIPIQPFVAYTLDKTADQVEITSAGQTVNYTVKVTNTGDAAIGNVVATDPMLILSAPSGDANGNNKLDINEIWSYTGTYVVTQSDINQNGNNINHKGVLSNTASVSGEKRDGTPAATLTVSRLIPLNTTSAFKVIKTADRAQITAAGQLVNYTISVQNIGTTAISAVQMTDPMLSNSTGPDGDINANKNLDVGETWTYKGTYTVSQANIDNQGNLYPNGKLSNIADVTGNKPDGSSAGHSTSLLDIPINPAASFSLSKTSNVNSVARAGDLITYSLTVKNTGAVAINTFTVSDPMVNLRYQSGDVNADGKLDLNETWIYSGTYSVTQADIDNNGNGTAGKLINQATANGRKPDGTLLPDVSATNQVNIVPVAGIAILKASPETAITKAGQVIPYTITVTNTGTVALSNVTVTDPMLSVSALALTSGDRNGNGKLDLNETWTYTTTYLVKQDDIDKNGNGITVGNLVNTATVNGESPNGPIVPVPSNQVTIPIKSVAAYSIEKTSTTTAITARGQLVPYTITVKNVGDAAISNLVVKDNMLSPVPLALTSGDANNNGKLDVNETWTYTSTYSVLQTDIDQNGNTATKGILSNTASVSGTAPNGMALPGLTSTKIIPLNTSTSFTVKKMSDQATVTKAGDLINYTIKVTNTGHTAISHVVMNDPLIGGNITTISVGDTNNNGVLDVNEQWIYKGSYTVTQNDIDKNGNSLDNNNSTANGNLINVVTVTGNKPDGSSAGTVTAMNVVPISPVTAFTLNKSSNVNQVSKAGDLVVYTVTVKNTGAAAINTFVINDPMVNLTYQSGDSNTDGKLDVTETWIYTGTYAVKQTDVDNNGNGISTGKLVSTVTANGRKPDGTPTPTVTATVNVNVQPLSAMSIVKSSTTTLINIAGQNVPYTVTIANTGNTALSNIMVTDPMLPNLSYINGDVNGNSKLDVNETWTYTGNYTVSQADIDNKGNTPVKGNLTNTASATGNNPDGSSAGTVISTKDIPVQQTIAINFTKIAVGQIGYIAGQIVTYELKVTNIGNTTLKNIVVTDPNAVITNGSPIAQLIPGQVVLVNATHTLTQADVDAGKVINQASLTGTDPNGGTATKKSDDPSTVNPDDLTVTQIISPGSISLVKTAQLSGDGNTIKYTFTVKNSGIVTLSNVTISDTKITGAILVNPSTLAPGKTGIATANYTITAIEKAAGQVSNTAIVTGTSPNGFKVNDVSGTNENNNTPTLVILPKITGTKTVTDANANGMIEAGEVLTYTITITNNGAVDRTGVSISDPIPANTTYLTGSASNPGVLSGNILNWNNLTVPANGNLSISFKTTAAASLPLGLTAIANIANIIDPTQPGTPIVVETSLPTEGKLESVKAVNDSKGNKDGIAQANEVLTYNIQIKNSGGSALTGIKINDLIPTGLTYVIGSASNGGSFTQSNNTLSWSVNLIAGAMINLSFDATVPADVNNSQEIKNIAGILSPNGQTLQPVVSIKIDPSADLLITKELLTQAPIRTGDRIAYKITVVNAGENKATGVKVKDALPGNLDIPYEMAVTKGTTNYTANSKTLNWVVGDLGLNEMVTLTFKTRVMATGTLVNTATMTGDQPDPDPSNNTASSRGSDIGGDDLFIPNLFTPNGDGNNDSFEIRGLDQFPENELVIVNRWGNEVFRVTKYQNNWTGEGLNEGTYYYLLKVRKAGLTQWKVFKGYVTLIRAFKK